jgi:hypothetical protein
MTTTRDLSASEREWLRVRDYLREQRHALDKAAAARYPDLARVADTTLLTAPNWVPSRPFPLADVELVFEPERPFRPVIDSASSSILPTRPDGTKYAGYSYALGEIAAPSVFENRPTYRLLDADLSGPRGRMVFGRGKYFDGIDTGEAAAHEFAARQLDSEVPSTLRDSIGNPCDLTRRPANLAISTLTSSGTERRANRPSTCIGGIPPRSAMPEASIRSCR